MTSLATALSLACLASVAVLLFAESRGQRPLMALAKTGASGLFIAVAVALGAAHGPRFGALMLLALVLSAVGDVCLLSERPRAFMAGLGFFLLAHLVFSAAFALAPLPVGPLALAMAAMALVGGFSLRWLWPHLTPAFRWPVLAYIGAIMLMCALALTFAAATGRWLPAAGALLFAASDLAVARQSFAQRAFVNKLWGLPAYYIAQLLMAWSVAG